MIAADFFIFLGDNSINKPVARGMFKAELTYQETQEQLQVQPYSTSLFGEVSLVQSTQACSAQSCHTFPVVQAPTGDFSEFSPAA